ncbi:MAG: FAD-dependent oxidoreductase [Micrococcales bacterium]|nr:FAD-dependent oxidoreductase [Micrococcales bacterium]
MTDDVKQTPKILIVGGGYAGFYTAFKLQKQLRRNEATITVVDPLPYMTYQPFLPEIAAGNLEARHALVPLRRHLSSSTVLAGRVTGIDHASKTATITPAVGEPWQESYDIVVVTAGSVSRTFPIPGVADEAIGMKQIEEAESVRDRMVQNFDAASVLPKGDPQRARLLTVTVVGGGFAGIETIAELRSFASTLLKRYVSIDFDETKFHMIEALGRIMPEVSLPTSLKVIENLTQRGVEVHLNTQLASAVGGTVELSTGESFESNLIIWTAGVMPTPVLRNTDLPLGPRGHLNVEAELRVVDADGVVVPDAWGAGDVAQVPDLTGGGVNGYCVPNAQHAVRQGKRLAKNLVATLRGELPKKYIHKNLGAVAGLGVGVGAFQSGKIGFVGVLAWFMHRGYHGLAMPMWERKFRIFGDYAGGLFLGRDEVGIPTRGEPREVFERWASRPKPPAAEPSTALAPEPAKPARAPRKPRAKVEAATPGE